MENIELHFYLTDSKGDDYGASVQRFVHTTKERADEYYGYQEVSEDDVEVLKKYFDLIPYEDELEIEEPYYN